VTTACELVLLLATNRWTGGGKWLPRRLAEVDSDQPGRLVEAQRAAFSGERAFSRMWSSTCCGVQAGRWQKGS
jgi:hypothetical protein